MNQPRSGLTLIELVAALALLAMIVTVSLPIIQGAAAALQSTSQSISVEDLGLVADRVMSDPKAFRIESLGAIENTKIEWPEDVTPNPPSDPIVLEVVRNEESQHAWVRFSVGKVVTMRWLALEKQP